MLGKLMRARSFRFKLAAGISALALGVVAIVGAALTELHDHRLARDLDRRGELYIELLRQQLRPVVAFDDRATAREIFESIALDNDVEGVAVYDSTGAMLEGIGTTPKTLPATQDELTYTGAVVSREGPTGTAFIKLATERLLQERHESLLTSFAVAGAVAAAAFAFAWLFARTVTRRLELISREASRIAGGDLHRSALDPGAPDEIGRLATAFNSMVIDLRSTFTELAAGREQYRLITESTNAIPFEYVASQRRFTYVGPQAERVLGHGITRWSEPGFLELLVQPRDYATLAQQFADNEHVEIEREVAARSASGEDMHLRVVAAAGHVDGERCVRGLIIDMTERRCLEAELSQAQKLEAVGRLAAGVAHEINTPIQFVSDNLSFVRTSLDELVVVTNRLRTAVSEMSEHGDPTGVGSAAIANVEEADLPFVLEELPKSLAQMADGLRRVGSIVKSLKVFAHPDRSERTIADLNHAIESTLTIARNEYRYFAELETCYGDLPPLDCYLGEINQVVLNIVVNAAHAIADTVKGTERKGKITVRTARDRNDIVISISDTGGGIPEHVRDRIFDPFFTTKEVGRGTGQGLAIARSVVVDRHKGSLTFQTEMGVGTTFMIRLPIQANEAAADSLAAA
jgi:signal transduction histidine kinase/HAMP domain-containing protein